LGASSRRTLHMRVADVARNPQHDPARATPPSPPRTETLRAAKQRSVSAKTVTLDRDQFIDAVRRVAARDRSGFAEPDDVATELGIGLFEVTELVRRYQDYFKWDPVPLGKLKLGFPG
jgi:hypothetical protein